MTQDLHHLAAAYALDALDADERAAFEAHYPSCEICSGEVRDFRETAGILGGDVAVGPPAELKQKVMGRIGETRQLSPLPPRATGSEGDPDATAGPGSGDELSSRRALRLTSWVLGAAAAAVLVIAGVFVSTAGDDQFADVVAASDAAFATLEGDTVSIEAIWSSERDRVALVASSLKDPGPGRAYALWLLSDGGPVPAGLFVPDDEGNVRTVLAVDGAEATARWAVTIEPDTGSPVPTGEILFTT